MFLYKNCIYYIWQRAIKRAADESGAFKNVSEDDLAQYVGDTAKLFADQVLAEAQMRNEPIDTVLKASDIVYEDGGIKLNVRNKAGVSGENTMYQLPQNAYDTQGKADINTPEFKTWSGGSEVVTSEQAKSYNFETGKAVTVEGFHGSDRLFNAFKKRKSRGLNNLGQGFYFANSKQKTSAFGDNLYELYISFKNPFVTERSWFYKDELESIAIFLGIDKNLLSRDNVNDYLAKAGYDGVISKKTGDYVAFLPNQIKSVYNHGTFDSNNDNIYYQRAFAGSRVDYDRPSLEAIGSGEGSQSHGWGLYYALDKDVAESYRKRFTSDRNITYKGKDIVDYYNDGDYVTYGALNALIDADLDLEVAIKSMKQVSDINRSSKYYDEEIYNETMAIYNKLKEFDPNDIKETKSKGQVHEVEIPENPYLLDEQKYIGEQSDIIKKGIRNTLMRLKGLAESGAYPDYKKALTALDYEYADIENRIDNPDFYENKTGYQIYDIIEQIMGSDREASLFLLENGIKGITYEGRQDGRAFVIFNPDDVEVIQKFYQGQIADNGQGVELTINSQEEMRGLSNEEFDKKVIDTLKALKGKKVFNNSLNGDIEIRASSIKKYRKFFGDRNKHLIVPYIPELLAKAKFVRENSYTPATERNIKAYYKADLPINIDNTVYNVHLTVKEDNLGNYFYDLQVKNQAPQTGTVTKTGVEGLTSELSEDTLSITQTSGNVNNTNYQNTPNPKGLFDANRNLIKIFESADFSTLPHELAHYWLNNMWNYTRSGNASERYRYKGRVKALSAFRPASFF